MTGTLVFLTVSLVLILAWLLYFAGRRLAVIEWAVFFAWIQWVWSPLACYELTDLIVSKPSLLYMSFAVLSCISLMVIFFFYQRKHHKAIIEAISIELQTKNTQIVNKRRGFLFIIIGFVSKMLAKTIGEISVVGTFITFLSPLYFVGIIFLISSNLRQKVYVVIFLIALDFSFALQTSLLYKSVTWSILIGSHLDFKYRFSFLSKSVLVLVFIPVILFVQMAKGEYRANRWGTEEISALNFISDLGYVYNSTKEGDPLVLAEPTLRRLNQGHIDIRVFENISRGQSLLYGRTIVKSFASALIPRTLWTNKYGYTDRKVKELANYYGNQNAFFSVSIMAETYANFGLYGGLAFIIIFIVLIKKVYLQYLSSSTGGISNFYFAPLIFFTILRTEVDYYQWFASVILGMLSLKAIIFIVRKMGVL